MSTKLTINSGIVVGYESGGRPIIITSDGRNGVCNDPDRRTYPGARVKTMIRSIDTEQTVISLV